MKSLHVCVPLTPHLHVTCYRLPFSIKCAPEIFQRSMDHMVEDLDGVVVITDDVIVAGDEATHDTRLQKFLERSLKRRLKLNKEKCKIRQKEEPYVGHLLVATGLKIDLQKVRAMQEMPEPRTKYDVKGFFGSVQFLSRYLPALSIIDAP